MQLHCNSSGSTEKNKLFTLRTHNQVGMTSLQERWQWSVQLNIVCKHYKTKCVNTNHTSHNHWNQTQTPESQSINPFTPTVAIWVQL